MGLDSRRLNRPWLVTSSFAHSVWTRCISQQMPRMQLKPQDPNCFPLTTTPEWHSTCNLSIWRYSR